MVPDGFNYFKYSKQTNNPYVQKESLKKLAILEDESGIDNKMSYMLLKYF